LPASGRADTSYAFTWMFMTDPFTV
jgi:hypothetical protein